MSVRGRVGSAVGSAEVGAKGGAVESGGAVGSAHGQVMTEQILHIGKGARAADFG